LRYFKIDERWNLKENATSISKLKKHLKKLPPTFIQNSKNNPTCKDKN
jgi:hypothetical protein